MNVMTDNNAGSLIEAGKVVLVDFWAPWCGPCRALSPVIDDIAAEYEGKVSFAKCNVDDAEEVAVTYGIRSVPTLIFFKDGKMVDRLVGAVPKVEITAKLDSLI